MDYLKINKASWDERAAMHYGSEFYDNESFLKHQQSLQSIELGLLGNIKGKSVLHLQCHFGQDTISLQKLGANSVGVDLSEVAIQKAEELAELCESQAQFVCSDIYDLPKNLKGQFDIVFTSYGTIGWLPDINQWADVVSHFLKKDGVFCMVDFHPVVWMYDDDFTEVTYKYFNSEPIVEIESGSYANKESDKELKSVNWNHGLAEIVMSLINHNIVLSDIQEYDYSPYDCFNKCVKIEDKKYRLQPFGDKIPMLYSIVGVKK